MDNRFLKGMDYQAKYKLFLILVILFFTLNAVASSPNSAPAHIKAQKTMSKGLIPADNADSTRRAKPAPFDSIFPNTEYLGPTIGVPNTAPIYPLNRRLWNLLPSLEENNIRIYGWVNPSVNASSSKYSNYPLSYSIVPNNIELEQLVLRVERQVDTVQVDHIDWGFRLSNVYGIDYRFTTMQGVFSNQLLGKNQLYGYDPVEAYGQLYFPAIAQGMVVTVGRYISPADIEAQLAPQNYLVTHSIMFTVDTYTQAGITSAIKFNDTWTILVGLSSGSDMAPWAAGAHVPTLLALVRWVSDSNNDSLWGGINSVNNGKFKGNHDNLQQFNVDWTHRFNEKFLSATELYYIYQFDAVVGGTCNFGPVKPYGGGGGCGPAIPGTSRALGAVNYMELKVSDKDFMSFRTDYLNDYEGERTGFATEYMSWTLGVTHFVSSLIEIRPELRYETAFDATPYNNGTKKNQFVFIVDAIVRF